MIIELHILQNVAPANLNRDDTGSPKDCVFGGVRRSRISSQALKRAARKAFGRYGISEDELGVRTRKVGDAIVERLVDVHGRDPERAAKVAEHALATFEITGGEYLLFVSPTSVAEFADLCNEMFDVLERGKLRSNEQGELTASRLFAAPRQVDIALFGRMVADIPVANVDAATQVAHAISTHEVRPEFDYFTAVDDLVEASPEGETGAGHIDILEFNSACYYRYAAVDTNQLIANLAEDEELARRGLSAFLMAMIHELPSGKQNSMAAHNPPSLVMTTVRETGQWNLANAFEDPVLTGDGGLIAESVGRLLHYYGRLAEVFDANRPAACHLVLLDDGVSVPDGMVRHPTVTALVDATTTAAFGGEL